MSSVITVRDINPGDKSWLKLVFDSDLRGTKLKSSKNMTL